MVQLTQVARGSLKTFGSRMKRNNYNHRIPLKYQRFQEKIDPEEIVEYYSQENIPDLRAGQRTYKDAQQFMGRKNYLLPNLSEQDLEMNRIFQKELDRQREIVARVNKISIIIDSVPGKGKKLMMNQDISTPFDCARHIHELLTTRSVVAELSPLEDDSPSTKKEYWDMHRPLESSCRLKFRHFSEDDVSEVNRIYWRSCSFVLGMALKMAFKDDVKILLHSWPKPNIKSGSFVYDAALNLSDVWQPTEKELLAFTKIMWNIKSAELPFDRLQVKRDEARSMFQHNPFKLAQIDSILENESSQGKLTVYRCGGLLDISVGPMISNTSLIGRISLVAVHPFESNTNEHKGLFYRFQGVSLPQQLPVSSYLYQNILISNARKLNRASL